jgi:hypothetical protein
MKMVLLLSVLFCAVLATPSFKWKVGMEINYAVNGLVDSKGQQATGVQSEASIGSLTGIFATKCLSFNATQATFVANMFDGVVGVSQGPGINSEEQINSDEQRLVSEGVRACFASISFATSK